MKWLLIVVLLVASGTQAQVKKLELRGPWRLNTVSSDLSMKLGDLRIAHNLDFGANLGAMTIRRGYDSISTILGMDSILGIYGAYYSDGTQQLFIVADSNKKIQMVIKITPTAINDSTYLDSINSDPSPTTYTSDASATVAEITAGMTSAINADANVNGAVTAYDSTTFYIIQADVAGTAFTILTDAAQDTTTTQENDEDAVGYGNVYVTQKGSVNISSRDSLTRIWQYWGVQNRPSFTMSDDNVYIVNGQQRGIVWNGRVARTWPPRAPGEPLIIPLNGAASAGYGLDGEYRYRVYVDSGLFTAMNSGEYLSAPIRVNNGTVLITGLTWPRNDSLTTTDTSSGADTIRYRIKRTRANSGPLDRADSIWLVKDTTIYVSSRGSLADVVFIDSIPDDTNEVYTSGSPTLNRLLLGRDSSGALVGFLGAPGYVSMDTADTAAASAVYTVAHDTIGDINGIFFGIPTQKDTLGVAYACTFIDTNTAIESDTGRALFVWNDEGSNAYSVTVSLPRISSIDSGLVINLYRAHILQVTYDSSYWDTTYTTGHGALRIYNVKWVSYLAVDTVVVGSYFLQGQYVDTVTQVTDSIRFDSLSTRREFTKTSPPSLTSSVFSWDNRLWSIEEQKVWNSQITNSPFDTLQSWMQANPIPINPDDGDQVTLAYPSNRGLIRVFKNFSNYNIFQNSNLEWARTEVSGTHGCIAPNSYARGFSGHYYLSASGVVRETEGPTIERTQSIELVSAPIKSFDQMSLIDKSKAVGFYDDRKYMIYVPAAGTTYVYDERANAWSTWDLVFQGATKYGVESELGFFPGDTMYYFNGNTLYLLGLWSAWDSDAASTPVIATWQTGPLFPDGGRQSIEKVGAWIKQDAGKYYAKIAVTNESGTVSDSILFNRATADSVRFVVKGIGANNGIFLLLGGTNQVDITNTTPSIIDGIDIWYTDEGPVIVE